MKDFYKLYIGDVIDKGMPDNAHLEGVVIKDLLKLKINLLSKTLLELQDLYIEDINHNVSAYKRDNLEKIYG